jgi:hypothetical protein
MSKLSSRFCFLLFFCCLLPTLIWAQGLTGTYFGTRTLDGAPILTRIDPMINFEWMNGSPDPAIANDNFSVRWRGTITVNATGNYQLGLKSDDGCRVWIDDRMLVDAWKDTGPTLFANQTRLVAGRATPIMIEYYEATGGSSASLMIAPEGQATALVPSEWLNPNIIEHQGLPKVGLFSNDTRATEGRDRLNFTVYRIGGLGTALAVRISLGDQVTAGVDYVPFNTEITIPAYASATTVSISPLNDDLYQGLRTINLTVIQSDTYTRQTDQPLVLQIIDDEREIQEAYTIAGEITGDTNLPGNVILEVTPVIADLLDETQMQRFTFVEAGFFSTSRLAPNLYELWAFLDQNENGTREMDEPQGFWPDGSVRWRVALPPDQYQANLRFKLLLDQAIPDQHLTDFSMMDQGQTDLSVLALDQTLMDEKLANDQSQTSNDQMTQVDDMNTQMKEDMHTSEGENPSSNNTESKKNQESGCDTMTQVLSFAHLLSMLLVYLSIIIMRKTRLFYLNPQYTRK